MEDLNEKSPKKRATKYQLEKRVHEVLRLIEKGHSYGDIIKICQTKLKWDLEERQIKHYIAKAQRLVKELPPEQMNSIRIRKKLEHHYEKYVEKGLDSKAVSVLKELNKMDRTKKVNKVVHQTLLNDSDEVDAWQTLIDVFKEDSDFRKMAHRASEEPEYGFVYTTKNISMVQLELMQLVQSMLHRIPEDKIIAELEKREQPEIREFVLSLVENIKGMKI